MTLSLDDAALRLVSELRSRGLRIVFAESCTGGLVTATLAKIPGVSSCLCGSLVTYSDEAKTNWLGVDAKSIAAVTAVSDVVAAQMAAGALRMTPSADIAASVTGHLGPGSPPGMDGIVFIATLIRMGQSPSPLQKKIKLESVARTERQREAAVGVLDLTCTLFSPARVKEG